MAEEQSTNSKRRVKNPETFRERAVKASEGADKPNPIKRLFRALIGFIKLVLSPFVRLFKKIFDYKIFKPVKKVLKFIGKIIFPKYLRESWQELRKVTWPNWKLSRQLTSAVLIFAIVFGVVIAIVDYGLDKLFRDILLK